MTDDIKKNEEENTNADNPTPEQNTPQDNFDVGDYNDLFSDLEAHDSETVETLSRELDILKQQGSDMQAENEKTARDLEDEKKKIAELEIAFAKSNEETKKSVADIVAQGKAENSNIISEFVNAQMPILDDVKYVLSSISPEARAADPDVERTAKSVEIVMKKMIAAFEKISAKKTAPAEAPVTAETPAEASAETTPATPSTTEASKTATVTEEPAAETPATVEALRAERDAQLKKNVSLLREKAQVSLDLKTAKARSTLLEANIARSGEEMQKSLQRAMLQAKEENNIAVVKVIKVQMPVIDDIEIVVNSVTTEARKADPEVNRMITSVETTMTKLMDVFNKFGIKQINPLNEEFDDEKGHEAIGEDNSTEGLAPGTITKVAQKGYEVNGEIIRTAKVVATPLF